MWQVRILQQEAELKSEDLVRAEEGLVGFYFFIFFLCFVFSMFAHAATRLAAALTEVAIRTGVLLKEDYFSHFFILTYLAALW